MTDSMCGAGDTEAVLRAEIAWLQTLLVQKFNEGYDVGFAQARALVAEEK